MSIKTIEIEGEKVRVKKGFDGWRVIYPWKNEDGTFNWFNILTGGSYWKLIGTTIIVLMIVLAILEYTSNLQYCADFINNYNSMQVNISKLNIVT